jgi:hypothetical protein
MFTIRNVAVVSAIEPQEIGRHVAGFATMKQSFAELRLAIVIKARDRRPAPADRALNSDARASFKPGKDLNSFPLREISLHLPCSTCTSERKPSHWISKSQAAWLNGRGLRPSGIVWKSGKDTAVKHSRVILKSADWSHTAHVCASGQTSLDRKLRLSPPPPPQHSWKAVVLRNVSRNDELVARYAKAAPMNVRAFV